MGLFLPANIAHPAADGILAFVSQQDIAGAAQIISPLPGTWVIEADRKIALCGVGQPLFEQLPGRQQIREGDDAEDMPPERAAVTPGTTSMSMSGSSSASSKRGPAIP